MKLTRTEKRRNKAAALVAMLRAIQPAYLEAPPEQRSMIETTMGAAIFYLGQPQALWTGRVSVGLLRAYARGEQRRPVKDHLYPRKSAARALLSADWLAQSDAVERLLTLYEQKYGTYNLVHSTENKQLASHQVNLDLARPYLAYQSAGVELVDSTIEQMRAIKRGESAALNAALERPVLNLTEEHDEPEEPT